MQHSDANQAVSANHTRIDEARRHVIEANRIRRANRRRLRRMVLFSA
jgi:hypothetical protein